jgi:uncharacterized membrane protein YczE
MHHLQNLAVYIGIGMVVIGLGLAVYIVVKIVEESRRHGDEPFDR